MKKALYNTLILAGLLVAVLADSGESTTTGGGADAGQSRQASYTQVLKKVDTWDTTARCEGNFGVAVQLADTPGTGIVTYVTSASSGILVLVFQAQDTLLAVYLDGNRNPVQVLPLREPASVGYGEFDQAFAANCDVILQQVIAGAGFL